MLMLWNILGAAAVAALIILLIWALRGLMLTPVRAGAHTRLAVRLDVTGPEPSLESSVYALLWLDANGTLPCEIEICDLGMDEATLAVAETLARGDGRISLLSAVRRTEEGD